MVMPAGACYALQRRSAQSVDYHFPYIPIVMNPENNPCIQTVSGLPPKFYHLFTGPLPICPENFMQIRLEVFVQSC